MNSDIRIWIRGFCMSGMSEVQQILARKMEEILSERGAEWMSPMLVVLEEIESVAQRVTELEDLETSDHALDKRLTALEGQVETVLWRLEAVSRDYQKIAGDPVKDLKEKVKSKFAPAKTTLPPKANGRYCLQCDKPLTGAQNVFCTQSHAGIWTNAHRGTKAKPIFKARGTRPETIVAGEGVR